MNEKRGKKKYLAGLLALALAAAGFTALPAMAARAVETDRTATLTVGLGEEGAYREDLSGAEIQVSLYQVAVIDAWGNFTQTEDFAALDLDLSASTTAADWEALALAAAELAGAEDTEAEEALPLEPSAEISVTGGEGETELPLGLYLLLAAPAETSCYQYTFEPVLVSLPGNSYRQSGAGEDQWFYEVSVSLKPEQSPRYGGLRIVKTLDSYQEVLGPVTFVFQIEGVDGQGNVVYSNVAATTHTGAGVVEALAEHIPAGTVVTVTEVYSGASYTLTSPAEQTVTIEADTYVEAAFSNTYDNELTPGYGAVNQFTYQEDGGWQWNRLENE